MKLVEKIERNAVIRLISGLHIGGADDTADIGGVDSPVVRLKLDGSPYIPGSSLKGKIRSLLEVINGATEVGDSPIVNSIFGITESKKKGIKAQLSRLIFRDCYMTESSKKLVGELETDLPFTEIKWENTIDRIKGAAKKGGLRNIERVVAGSEFYFSVIINIYDNDDKAKILDQLTIGINLLQNDYLGGSGTRGYGQIQFMDISDKSIWKA